MARRSPTFTRPPLVETVLGVQFDPLSNLRLAHLAAFLLGRSVEPAAIREIPGRGQTVEPVRREELWAGNVLRFDLSDVPPVRLLATMTRPNGTRLVQVENGWLGFNWQSQIGGAKYPRYGTVRPEFDEWLGAFTEFLRVSSIGDAKPNHWEVVYVNVIPRGELWDDVRDWPTVFPRLFATAGAVRCGSLQTAGGRWVFDLAPILARLHIVAEHGQRSEPKPEEVLRLKLTARGRIEEQDWARLAAGFDLGHDAIVHTFVELASEKALKHWGYEG